MGASLPRGSVHVFFRKLSLFQAVGNIFVDAARMKQTHAKRVKTQKHILYQYIKRKHAKHEKPNYRGKSMSENKKADIFSKIEPFAAMYTSSETVPPLSLGWYYRPC